MPLIFFALLTAFAGWVWLRSQPPNQRKPALLKLLLVAAVVGMIFLAATGRLYLVFGLLAAMLPFLRRLLPGLFMGRLGRVLGGAMGGGSAKPKPGNQSRVATDILDMTLDHDTEAMDGSVLKGPLAGKALADLGETEFIELLQYCREHDVDSARLLETYLDRRFGDSWRDDDTGTTQEDTDNAGQGSSGGPLTEHEALDVLGLEAGASRDDIVQAHRRLMQKMHPDRGGSTYLAARINEAKARLLD